MTKESERLNHISYWEQSGQTKKAYSELAGIKYATFISWFRNKPLEQDGKFIKLEKSERPSVIEIVLPNGIRIFSDQYLSLELLKTLQDV